MDETVVNFYYQSYELLTFYTCSNIFSQFHTNVTALFYSAEGVTIFEGNRRSGRESPMQLFFFLSSHYLKIKTKTAVYEAMNKPNVCVFVMTTIST